MLSNFRSTARETSRSIVTLAVMVGGSLAFGMAVHAAPTALYVTDPVSCPSEHSSFPGQKCSGGLDICGYVVTPTGDVAQCYDTSTMADPAAPATSNTQYSSGHGGGFVLNCFALADGAAPFCDNAGAWLCNRDASCYTTKQRDTACAAPAGDVGAFSCGSCRTGYQDCLSDDACEVQTGVTNYPTGANNNYAAACGVQCDTGYLDCDASGAGAGNGCEIQEGASCTIGGVTGTYQGCSCVPQKSYFETGTNTSYGTADPLLWGTQYGTGKLISFNNGSGEQFAVYNSGALRIGNFADGTGTGAGTMRWTGADFEGYDGSVWISLTGATSSLDDTYVNVAGDTMTGALVIDLQGLDAGIGLEVIETISGSTIFASNGLSTSGTLLWQGAATGASLWVTTFDGAGLTDCDLATDKIVWDAVTKQFDCAADLNVGTGLDLGTGDARYVNIHGDTMTGALVIDLRDVSVGIGLEVIETISGSTIFANRGLSTSGSLVWEEAASGASLYVATSFRGSGLADCDLSTQKLQWDSANGRFTCGTDLTGGTETFSGSVLTLIRNFTGSFLHLQTISGATLHTNTSITTSGSITWETFASGSSLWVSTLSGAGLTDCDLSTQKLLYDAQTERFTCGTDGGVPGTNVFSGAVLTLIRNYSGSLLHLNTVSGSTIHANNTLTSSGTLTWETFASGSSLWVSTLSGAGLTDCDLSTQKLLYNADTERFTCGTDLTGGTETFSGSVLTLIRNYSGSLLHLNTVSGSVIHANRTISSSGGIVWETMASGSSLWVSTLSGAGLTDCDLSTQKLLYNADTERFTCGVDQNSGGAGTTVFSGSVLTLIRNYSGSLLHLNTVSGSTIHANNTLTSSGTLTWETFASGSSLWVSTLSGAGLTDCDLSTQKLLYNADTERFTCGVDQNSGGAGTTVFSGSVLTLINNFSGSLLHLNTVSGSTIHANNTLTSSGTLTWETFASGSSLWVSTLSGAGLTDCDLSTQKLLYNADTERFTCGVDQNSGGAGNNVFSGAVLTLIRNYSGSLLHLNTVSGSTIHANNTLTSSGTLTWETFASGSSLWVSTLSGAGLTDCDLSSQKLLYDVDTERFTCGVDQEGAGSVTAGQGLSKNGSVLALNSSISGSSLVFQNLSGSFVYAANVLSVSGVSYLNGNVGIGVGSTTSKATLSVTGTVSGATLYAVDALRSSGALVWGGAGSGASLWVSTLSGAGLTDCDLSSQKLLYDAQTERFTCGTDQEGAGSVSAGQGLSKNGSVLTLSASVSGSLLEFNTVSGALVYAERQLSVSGSVVLGDDTGDSIVFNGDIDSNFNPNANTAYDMGNAFFRWRQGWFQSLNASTDLGVSGTTTLNGNVGIGGSPTTTKAALNVLGTISGSIVYAERQLSVSGSVTLGDDAADNVVFNADVNSNILPNTNNSFDLGSSAARWANGWFINANLSSNLAVLGTSSLTGNVGIGSANSTNKAVLAVTGTISGSTVYATKSFSGAGLADCDTAGSSKLLWDATTGRFSCGTDQTGGSSLTAGQGLALNGSVLTLNSSISGSLLEFQTVSGALVYAKNTLASSGSLVWEGAGSGSSLYTGTLGIGIGSVDSGLKLEIAGTASGRVLYAQQSLRSSGSLVWEGAASGATLYVGGSIRGSGLATDCDASSSKLLWDTTTGRFTCGTDLTSSNTAGQGLSLVGSTFRLNSTFSGTLLTSYGITFSSGGALSRINGYEGYINLPTYGLATDGIARMTNQGNLINIHSIQAGATHVVRGGVFLPKTDYYAATGTPSVWGIATGDFDGDGYPDMAAGIFNAMTVFMNNGDGTFATKVDYALAAGAVPLHITAADVNGDGKLDLITSNYGGHNVTVFINRGNGTFLAGVHYATQFNPSGITANDFNADGKVDIAVSNYGSNSVSILLNNGNGTFATQVAYSVGSTPYGLSAADFNGDGEIDLVAAQNYGSIYSILLNNGNGVFGASIDAAATTTIQEVTTGDFNQDGKADIAFTRPLAGALGVLLNTGNMTFATEVGYTVGAEPSVVLAKDVNADGRLDLIASNHDENTISVLLNNGDGTFAGKVNYPTRGGPIQFDANDFNRDGTLDLAVVDYDDGYVSVFMNDTRTVLRTVGSGAVGIGTYTPGSILSISGSALINPTGSIGSTKADQGIALEIIGTASGRTLFASHSLRSSGSLVWEGAGSGNSLIVSSTLGIGIGTVDSGLKLEIAGTASGRVLYAQQSLRSSGSLVWEGAGSGNSLIVSSTLGLGVGSVDSGLKLEIAGTASGRILYAQQTLASSGTLVWEGAASGASLYVGTSVRGAGLGTDCDASSSKLLWDTTTGRFSCGTDQTSGGTTYTAGQGLNLASTAFRLNTTISGSLLRFATVSGSVVYANGMLASSGGLVWEGAGSGSSLALAGGRIQISKSGSTVFNATNGNVDFNIRSQSDDSLFYLDASASRIGIGTSTPDTRLEVVGTISGSAITQNGPSSNYFMGKLGVGTTDPSGLLHIYGTSDQNHNILVDAGGTLSNQNATIAMITQGDGTKGLGVAQTLGWQLNGRGNAWATAEQQNDLTLEYWDGSQFSRALQLDSLTGRFSLGYSAAGKYTPDATLSVLGSMSGYTVFATNSISTSGSLVWNGAGSGGSLTVGGGTVAVSRSGSVVLNNENANATANVFQIITDVGGNEDRAFRIRADGTVFSDNAYNSSGADYAEWFFTSSSGIKPGDVVCIDVTKANTVKRCDRDADGNVMGIVSTNPAFIGNVLSGADGLPVPGTVLVGLIGQVPAKVIASGSGGIRPGDSLTAASKPGFARKALPGESTVGVALEPLASGEGTVNVLISRRNQSLTVSAVEQEVLEQIQAMEIGDEVELMVAEAMGDLNVDQAILDEVTRQVESLNVRDAVAEEVSRQVAEVRAEIESASPDIDTAGCDAVDAVLRWNPETGAFTCAAAAVTNASGAYVSIGEGSDLVASTLQLRSTLAVDSDARIAGDLYLDGGLYTNDLFIPGILAVDGSLTSSSLAVTGDADIHGTTTLHGPLILGSGSSLQFGSGLTLADLVVERSLAVLGEITVEGMARFLGDVSIEGELSVTRQAGHLTVPLGATGATFAFEPAFKGMPVVTASPNKPVLYAVSIATSTGFIVSLAGPADSAVTFSWLALILPNAAAPAVETSSGGALGFPVDDKGVPVSSSLQWNACIRGVPLFDASGIPYSCARYHDQNTWTQPDLDVSFVWNDGVTPPYMQLPDGYVATVTETSASIRAAIVVVNGEQAPDAEAPASSASSSESSSAASEAIMETAQGEPEAPPAVPTEQSSSSEAASSSSAPAAPEVAPAPSADPEALPEIPFAPESDAVVVE